MCLRTHCHAAHVHPGLHCHTRGQHEWLAPPTPHRCMQAQLTLQVSLPYISSRPTNGLSKISSSCAAEASCTGAHAGTGDTRAHCKHHMTLRTPLAHSYTGPLINLLPGCVHAWCSGYLLAPSCCAITARGMVPLFTTICVISAPNAPCCALLLLQPSPTASLPNFLK